MRPKAQNAISKQTHGRRQATNNSILISYLTQCNEILPLHYEHCLLYVSSICNTETHLVRSRVYMIHTINKKRRSCMLFFFLPILIFLLTFSKLRRFCRLLDAATFGEPLRHSDWNHRCSGVRMCVRYESRGARNVFRRQCPGS